jgi:DNA-binding MarR family transcriptional regulator
MSRRPFQKVLGRTPQVKILDYLATRKKPASVVEIRKKIKVHYIYATKLVNTLEAHGLLQGRREGRKHLVWLDEKSPIVKAIVNGKRR